MLKTDLIDYIIEIILDASCSMSMPNVILTVGTSGRKEGNSHARMCMIHEKGLLVPLMDFSMNIHIQIEYV